MGIGGLKESDEEPWYVVGKDLISNTLNVAQGHNHSSMFHNTLETSEINWIENTAPDEITMTAKIRYRQSDQLCTITKLADTKNGTESENEKYKVNFDQSQRAITPGQSIVFYQNEVCLGGRRNRENVQCHIANTIKL